MAHLEQQARMAEVQRVSACNRGGQILRKGRRGGKGAGEDNGAQYGGLWLGQGRDDPGWTRLSSLG